MGLLAYVKMSLKFYETEAWLLVAFGYTLSGCVVLLHNALPDTTTTETRLHSRILAMNMKAIPVVESSGLGACCDSCYFMIFCHVISEPVTDIL